MSNQYRPQGFSLLPTVVKNLLIINGLAFLSTIVFSNTLQIDLNKIFGLYYPGSDLFKPYQFVTHLFMHGNSLHLFSNMFALWMFGTTLENFWGPKRFLIFYFVTGIGAALLHTLVNYFDVGQLQQAASAYLANPGLSSFESFVFTSVPDTFKGVFTQVLDAWNQNPNSISIQQNSVSLVKELVELKLNIPTVGASGAVFGVLLAFGMTFPNSLIYVFFAIPIKAKYFVIIYGLLELYSGLQNNPSDNVAHFAHLGGMLFGYFLIKYWRRNRFKGF